MRTSPSGIPSVKVRKVYPLPAPLTPNLPFTIVNAADFNNKGLQVGDTVICTPNGALDTGTGSIQSRAWITSSPADGSVVMQIVLTNIGPAPAPPDPASYDLTIEVFPS